MTGVVAADVAAAAVAVTTAVVVTPPAPSLTLSREPFGFGTADRGIAVSVAVEGFDFCPLPPLPPVMVEAAELAVDAVASLPMNQLGTQPLSPVSILILLVST